jgi:predicted PurR-regulated permease PerM
MRTLLLVAAALAVMAAFWAIGDTFLIVFVGIFLAFVFEYPVRFVMEKTRMSRGLAATVTVIGTAIAVTVLFLLLLVPLVGSVRDFLQELPTIVEDLRDSGGLSWLGDSGAAENVQSGANEVSSRYRTRSPRSSGSPVVCSVSSSPDSRSSSSASSC